MMILPAVCSWRASGPATFVASDARGQLVGFALRVDHARYLPYVSRAGVAIGPLCDDPTTVGHALALVEDTLAHAHE